jgi:hypothetical protein
MAKRRGPKPLYTYKTRRKFVLENMNRGLSVRKMKQEIVDHFRPDKAPGEATVWRDMKQLTKGTYSEEAQELLKPENFPKFRKLFSAPGGSPYETNKTHHALYWVLYALTRKVDLPDWVIEHFDLPDDVNEDIVLKEKLLTFVLLVAPRHGKTMTMIHGLIALMAEYPDVRIVYCQGIKDTTIAIMQLIMIELETNEKLKELFGPFEDPDRMWSKANGFIVARREIHSITPTFLPVGITSNVRSRDADIIIIDDPQDEDRANSEATTSKDYRKITNEFMQRREPHTPVLMVGSHVPSIFGDVFTKLEDNLDDLQTRGQAVVIRKRPAHNLDICPDPGSQDNNDHVLCLEWPEKRDWYFLMAQKAVLDSENPGMFEAVYQQEARIQGTRPFPPELVKQTRDQGGVLDSQRSWKQMMRRCPRCDKGSLYATLGFDPATGEGKRASYTAVSVMQGCSNCQTLYLVDYLQQRLSPDLHASTIASFARSFDLDYVRIEINAYQKALARDRELLEFSRNGKQGFHIDEWRTDDRKNSPEFGIPKLAKWMREDKFSVPYQNLEDQTYAKEVIGALVRYPAKPNDLPMSMWLASGMLWEMFELYANPDPIYLPNRDINVPAYMIDNPIRVNLGDLEYSGT